MIRSPTQVGDLTKDRATLAEVLVAASLPTLVLALPLRPMWRAGEYLHGRIYESRLRRALNKQDRARLNPNR